MRQSLAQTVELQKLSLQLAELDRHRIEVALNHLLGFARFLALIVKQNRLKERMLD